MRLRGVLTSAGSRNDFGAELESHLQMVIDDNLRQGMNPQEARRQALIRLGGVEQARQAYREQSTLPLLESCFQDLGFALRQLGKSPGFACVVVVTLALSIGVNTALFSIVNAVLLHPLALPHAGELVAVDASKPNFPLGSISYPNFRDWQRENRSLAALAIYRHTGFVFTGRGESERLHGDYISSDFFSLLGVKPVLGRLFVPGEDEIGRSPVVLIGAGFWARKFGSSPDAIGKTLTLDGRDFTIVGVIPVSFNLSFRSFRPEDAYVPIGQWQTGALKQRGAGLGIHGIARLKLGVTLAQAQADMNNVSAGLAALHPGENHGMQATLMPLRRAIVGDVQPVLLILLGAVGFVLLIACVNVANLMLARSNARAPEYAVRLALGASRARILRQLLTESILLALTGGALGLMSAGWATGAALKRMPAAVPRAAEIHLSLPVLGFTFVLSCAVGIFFGLLPAWRVAARPPQNTLLQPGRSGSGARRNMQDWLVAFEMAAALLLLAGAGLMIRSLIALSHTHPGFDSKGVLTFSLAVPYAPSTSTPEAMRSYLKDLDETILNVPGVRAFSLAGGSIPMTGDDDEELFWMENEPRPANENDMHWALRYIVEPGYFAAMHIPLLRGRLLTDADRADGPPVVVIDQDFARRYFGAADPLGKQLNLSSTGGKATIVGVAGHVMQWELDGDTAFPLHSEVYEPFAQQSQGSLVSPSGFVSVLVVRADHPDTIFPDIQEALRRMNQEQVPYTPKTMDQIIAGTLAARRFSMLVLGVFAGLALLLASVGLYGLTSYLVGQRTQEIAIRMALGADRGKVLRWVLMRGAKMTLIGTGSGLLTVLLVIRLIAGVSLANTLLLYGVRPYDSLTMASVVAILLIVALAASYFPARRASSVDPIEALRS